MYYLSKSENDNNPICIFILHTHRDFTVYNHIKIKIEKAGHIVPSYTLENIQITFTHHPGFWCQMIMPSVCLSCNQGVQLGRHFLFQ